jgi:hypothetical protein
MQYILSQEEFDNFQAKKQEITKTAQKKLQDLCTKIADTMPIKRGWPGDPPEYFEPWGCILTKKYEWYCDSCPVTEICPHPYKHWSK